MANLNSPHNYAYKEYTTETGAQALIDVNPNHRITIAIISNQADKTDDVDIEVILNSLDSTSSPTRYLVAEDIFQESNLDNGKRVYVTTVDGPIHGVAINIRTNISNDFKLEVLTGRY